MQTSRFGNLDFRVSSLGLGTWVMGGWMWGGAREKESLAAIETSIASGVTLIDTAPVYGFGEAETVVGKAVAKLRARDRVILATKCGLEWNARREIRRNSSRKHILAEIDQSCERLQTDVIDIYQIHWPDEGVPFAQTAEVLHALFRKGRIRAVGVSNFDVSQMESWLEGGPLHSLQPPYNLFEREIEDHILPFIRKSGIAVLAYGALCRGLLTGKFTADASFDEGDVRAMDPKFRGEAFQAHRAAVADLKSIAAKRGLTVAQLAVQWVATMPGITAALAGARTPDQARENAAAFEKELTEADRREIEAAVTRHLPKAVDSGFAGPPRNRPSAGLHPRANEI